MLQGICQGYYGTCWHATGRRQINHSQVQQHMCWHELNSTVQVCKPSSYDGHDRSLLVATRLFESGDYWSVNGMHTEALQGGSGVLLRAPVPLSLVQQAWQQGPTAASCQVDQTLSLPEQGDGFRGGAWLVILREFVEAVVALSHLLLWLLLVLCAPWRAVSAILRIFEDSEDRFARLLRRDQHISLVNSHYSHCDRCLRRCECL